MPRSPYYSSPHWLDLRRRALQRDNYRCTVPGCGLGPADGVRLYVDHIRPRPYSDTPTGADTLENTRTLCQHHDQQVRQTRTGKRRNGGMLKAHGCGPDGLPLDPDHPWRAAGA